ncbi:hypothetical protein PRZ48_008841 [Zasmidium cellare]|uniref:Uncharacterized protein n=1 Tax=Zasmidium cellare TaxID=395010 RepID=A0ABR0EGQ8_ZASCE|nr:hypothetical protein PRZ48_008841 [Zasmidium cellare]
MQPGGPLCARLRHGVGSGSAVKDVALYASKIIEAASTPPQPSAAPKPKKKLWGGGRSNGKYSSKTIDDRVLCVCCVKSHHEPCHPAILGGPLCALLVRGVGAGSAVKPGTPIDDAVINQRHRRRRACQAAWAAKLLKMGKDLLEPLLAQTQLHTLPTISIQPGGPLLLKMGKKRFQEILEDLSQEEGRQGEVDIEDVRAVAMAAEAELSGYISFVNESMTDIVFKEVAEWTCKEEAKYEGDERVFTEVIHGRFLGLPQVAGNDTVTWQQRSVVYGYPFDDFYLKPTEHDVFWPYNKVNELEINDDTGCELIGNQLMGILDE